MSTFNTYSTDKKVVDFIIRNVNKINSLFIIGYAATYINIIFMKETISISSTAYLLLFLPGIAFLLIGFLVVTKFKKKLKIVGNIKFEKNTIVLNVCGNDKVLNASDIRKINIVKRIKNYFSTEDYNFVLADIILNDALYDNLIINKYSDAKNFEILKTLETYSKMNGIKYELRDNFAF
jgi:hypothetical protein